MRDKISLTNTPSLKSTSLPKSRAETLCSFSTSKPTNRFSKSFLRTSYLLFQHVLPPLFGTLTSSLPEFLVAFPPPAVEPTSSRWRRRNPRGLDVRRGLCSLAGPLRRLFEPPTGGRGPCRVVVSWVVSWAFQQTYVGLVYLLDKKHEL